MAFTYYLPDENGNKVEYGTSSNAVIIIGANGSGKSKKGYVGITGNPTQLP